MSIKRKFISALSGWYLWIFPLFAILITFALLSQHYEKKGEVIEIKFDEGMGIQPDRTLVRFKGVAIGKVTKVTIADDQKDIIAHVELDKGSERFAVENSKFSLVIPKVNFRGISGLETLVGGNYITVRPGAANGRFQDLFQGEIGVDYGEALEDTSYYIVETEHVGSVSVGDSVTFRGLKIGFVSKVSLSKHARSVVVQVNIYNQFTKLIRTNTHFWSRVAVHANLSLLKVDIKVNSLDALLNGGLAIATPDLAGDMAKAGTKFYLFPDQPKNSDAWSPVLEY